MFYNKRACFCRTGLCIKMPDVGCIYSEQTRTNVTIAVGEAGAIILDLPKSTLTSLLVIIGRGAFDARVLRTTDELGYLGGLRPPEPHCCIVHAVSALHI